MEFYTTDASYVAAREAVSLPVKRKLPVPTTSTADLLPCENATVSKSPLSSGSAIVPQADKVVPPAASACSNQDSRTTKACDSFGSGHEHRPVTRSPLQKRRRICRDDPPNRLTIEISDDEQGNDEVIVIDDSDDDGVGTRAEDTPTIPNHTAHGGTTLAAENEAVLRGINNQHQKVATQQQLTKKGKKKTNPMWCLNTHTQGLPQQVEGSNTEAMRDVMVRFPMLCLERNEQNELTWLGCRLCAEFGWRGRKRNRDPNEIAVFDTPIRVNAVAKHYLGHKKDWKRFQKEGFNILSEKSASRKIYEGWLRKKKKLRKREAKVRQLLDRRAERQKEWERQMANGG